MLSPLFAKLSFESLNFPFETLNLELRTLLSGSDEWQQERYNGQSKCPEKRLVYSLSSPW